MNNNYEDVMKLLLEMMNSTETNANVETNTASIDIPVGISNRHIHLSQNDLEVLFGKDYELTKLKDLSQPGQYACKETVTICGGKGSIEKVRILGPVRTKTQVEIVGADCFKLGVKSVVKQSGHLDNTPSITIIGPKGSVQIPEGVIVAQRHIHMHTDDANRMGLTDNQVVSIKVDGIRGGIYDNTVVRVSDYFSTECHIDTEEANAMGATSKTTIQIIK